MGETMYALLIADSSDESAILSLVLQRAGLAVTTANSVQRVRDTWAERPADMLLLAVPGDLISYVGMLRSITAVPIAIVTDRVSENTYASVLDAGADIIVMRPYSARLLVAELRALMRRAGGVQLFSLPTLNLSGLTLDPATRAVQVSGHPSRRLTHLEFRLLYTLMIHRGNVLSTESIVERVWGYSGRGDKELVRGLVRRLRTKVEPNPRKPRYILTIPGVGYSFTSDET
jgi:DNA-binding response OmpR family regulator